MYLWFAHTRDQGELWTSSTLLSMMSDSPSVAVKARKATLMPSAEQGVQEVPDKAALLRLHKQARIRGVKPVIVFDAINSNTWEVKADRSP